MRKKKNSALVVTPVWSCFGESGRASRPFVPQIRRRSVSPTPGFPHKRGTPKPEICHAVDSNCAVQPQEKTEEALGEIRNTAGIVKTALAGEGSHTRKLVANIIVILLCGETSSVNPTLALGKTHTNASFALSALRNHTDSRQTDRQTWRNRG